MVNSNKKNITRAMASCLVSFFGLACLFPGCAPSRLVILSDSYLATYLSLNEDLEKEFGDLSRQIGFTPVWVNFAQSNDSSSEAEIYLNSSQYQHFFLSPFDSPNVRQWAAAYPEKHFIALGEKNGDYPDNATILYSDRREVMSAAALAALAYLEEKKQNSSERPLRVLGVFFNGTIERNRELREYFEKTLKADIGEFKYNLLTFADYYFREDRKKRFIEYLEEGVDLVVLSAGFATSYFYQIARDYEAPIIIEESFFSLTVDDNIVGVIYEDWVQALKTALRESGKKNIEIPVELIMNS